METLRFIATKMGGIRGQIRNIGFKEEEAEQIVVS
jgi:hypothetical protein